MTSYEELTQQQINVLEFIRHEFRKENRPPTIREIAAHLNHKTLSSTQLHIRNLVSAGYLKRGSGHRSLQLTQPLTRGLRLLGSVAAGSPIEVFEQDERVDIGAQYDDATHFVLRVRGSSMIEDCIADGDYVVVRKQPKCENGELVVARIDGEVTLKRFYQEKKRIRLQPANALMKPMYYRDVDIEGVVVGVHRVMG